MDIGYIFGCLIVLIAFGSNFATAPSKGKK